jgi:Cu-Zn family superoxide dismutase
MIRLVLAAIAASIAVGPVGCGKDETKPASSVAASTAAPQQAAAGKVAVATLKPSQMATTQPANNNVTGAVTFTDVGHGQVTVVADVNGLAPNTEHGFHVHESGNLDSPDLASAGAHFNPTGHQHGAPGPASHAGDLGNLTADSSGHAHLELTVTSLSIGTGQPNDVVGRSVIVHAKPDDLKTQPAGNSGGRVAGGTIVAGMGR